MNSFVVLLSLVVVASAGSRPCKDPLPEAGLWQDSEDCQCFYQCAANNTAVRHCCKKEEQFDDINKVCAHKGSVVCNGNPPRVDCRGKRDGDYPDPDSCSSYWSCTNQLSRGPRPCPSGLHFKVTGEGEGECDYPESAGCNIQVTTPVVVVTTDGNGGCQCTTTTTQGPITTPCPCVTTTPSTTTTTRRTTTTTRATTPVPGKPCKDPLPEAGLWQDPEDCQCFYQCAANNTAVQLCCAEGQEFDDINKVCAHEGSVVCNGVPPRVDCRGKKDGDYPDPDSCSHYWSCSNQLSIGPRNCSAGLHFKVTGEGKGECVWPSEAGCDSSATTTTSSTTPAPPTTTPEISTTTQGCNCGDNDDDETSDLDRLCGECSAHHLVAHPHSQRKYVECNIERPDGNGTSTFEHQVRKCTYGLLFNANRLTCDLAQNVNPRFAEEH